MKAYLPTLLIASLALASCGDPSRTSAVDEYPTRLVVSEGEGMSNFHPTSGYGQAGVSPIYDGLLRPVPRGQGQLPSFEPALAAAQPARHGSTWTVTLKEGITFSDGTAFDAADVVASYEAAKDTGRGSEVAGSYSVIDRVEATTPYEVVFHLKEPLSDISARLTYPITPSEKLTDQEFPASDLAAHPVGTGAYKLQERRGNDSVFVANEAYWAGAPEIKELIITSAADDASRGQRVAAGELDGAVIPQVQAKNFRSNERVHMDVAKGADWRAVSLPAGLDPAVRRAMNLATNRQALIDGPLAGYGAPASTPISPVYGEAYNPAATFSLDVNKAEQLLDEAGWRRGNDGVRAKDGVRLEMPLYYTGADTTRRDVAIEFAAHMKKVGIDVQPTAGTWDEITPKMSSAAVILGGGEMPYDLTMAAVDYLHTRTLETGPYHNAGNYGSPELDGVLAQAMREADPARANELWHQAQVMYLENPSMVMIGTVDHVYVSKPNKWQKPELQLEPHVHGAMWGPWWRLAEWTR